MRTSASECVYFLINSICSSYILSSSVNFTTTGCLVEITINQNKGSHASVLLLLFVDSNLSAFSNENNNYLFGNDSLNLRCVCVCVFCPLASLGLACFSHFISTVPMCKFYSFVFRCWFAHFRPTTRHSCCFERNDNLMVSIHLRFLIECTIVLKWQVRDFKSSFSMSFK